MILWSLSFLFLFLGLRIFWSEFVEFGRGFRIQNELKELVRVMNLLHEIQETLEAGLVPVHERWQALLRLQKPWGELAHGCLEDLRAQGGAVLPTLRRLRHLAESHHLALKEAKSKASQALSQLLACLILVPLFGGTLYFILPGIEERFLSWSVGCAVSFVVCVIGMFWILTLADRARWGGLKSGSRSWILVIFCAGERFLAFVRSGIPADLAWTKTCSLLFSYAPTLAPHWGNSVWSGGEVILNVHESVEDIILHSSYSLRKAIQVSLLEGRPCVERVETALLALREDIRLAIDRELSLLGVRALKPLFICVAPALFWLLFFGLYLCWQKVGGVSFGLF